MTGTRGSIISHRHVPPAARQRHLEELEDVAVIVYDQDLQSSEDAGRSPRTRRRGIETLDVAWRLLARAAMRILRAHPMPPALGQTFRAREIPRAGGRHAADDLPAGARSQSERRNAGGPLTVSGAECSSADIETPEQHRNMPFLQVFSARLSPCFLSRAFRRARPSSKSS
jgi:hypothetical protein